MGCGASQGWRWRRLSGDVFHSGQDGERLEGEMCGEIEVAGELGWWLRMEYVEGLLWRRLVELVCQILDLAVGILSPDSSLTKI